jgi:hypothetical protein
MAEDFFYTGCRPGGEIGRHAGLKILWHATAVRVQVPPGALKTKSQSKKIGFLFYYMPKLHTFLL